MKIVFMGTPDFALTALKALSQKHDIICVYTQAPKEANRGHKLTKSSVHLFAEENNIPIRTPKTLRTEAEKTIFKELNADITIVAAYGLILPTEVIEAFPKGCVNIHGSLLPRWRGAAPIQRAIEEGDDKTGITIMNVVEALDAGDMLIKEELPINSNTTGKTLHDAMANLGAKLIIQYLDNIDNIMPEKQDETLVTYAKKIEKAEALLDFSLPSDVLERKIRAFNPYPATYFEHNNERFKIYKAKISDKVLPHGEILEEASRLFIGTKDNALEILEIQKPGKKTMPVKDLLNGFSFKSS